MNNPKPLDLEEIKKWVKQDLVVKEGNIDRAIDLTVNKLKQQIKEACEFYLRYKDNPSLLWKENPKYRKKLKKFGITEKWVSEDCDELYDWEDYNEWLFKLAFKGVLE